MDGAVKEKETKLKSREIKLENNERHFATVLEREVADRTATLKEHCENKIQQAQNDADNTIEENKRKLKQYEKSLDVKYAKLKDKNDAELKEHIDYNDNIMFNLMITMFVVVVLCFTTFEPLRNLVKTYFSFKSYDADGIALFVFNLIFFVAPLVYAYVKKYVDAISYHVVSIEFLVIAFLSNVYPDFNTGFLYCGVLVFIIYLVARGIKNIEDAEKRKSTIMNIATCIIVIAVFFFLLRMLGQSLAEITGTK